MWLMKRSRMDNHADVSDIQCQPLVRQHIANFSYPRTDFVHQHRKEGPSVHDSQGSGSSPPPMMEDHGSDLSAEDDCQYRVTGMDLWDSWHVREDEGKKPDYPAFNHSPAGAHETGFHQGSAKTRENPPKTRGSVSSGSQSGQANLAGVVPCSEQRHHGPPPPSKVCYSLFPTPPQKPVPAPLPMLSIPRQSGLEPSPLSLNFPLTPSSRGTMTDVKGNAMPTSRPGSSRATTPNSAHGGGSGSLHGGSIATSSSDSIPLLLRSPGPTPPASPCRTSSPSDAPRYPLRLKKRTPSQTNLRNFSLSKITTRSSPALAALAKAHRQAQAQNPQNKPLTPADLYDRPLPPLPTERPPSPPHISVFETDSDDEDNSDARPAGGETRSLARRFMKGLVHHHHNHHHHHHDDRREKGLRQDHKRSVSDEGPSSSKERSSRSGISRTLNVARYRRGGAVEAPSRAAVSMDLPRERGSHAYQQVLEEEEKSGGRFWGGRGGGKGGGELFLGRVFRRRG